MTDIDRDRLIEDLYRWARETYPPGKSGFSPVRRTIEQVKKLVKWQMKSDLDIYRPGGSYNG